MGFGDRVYKNYDPRAKDHAETCQEVLGELGIKDSPLLDIAMALERIALSDEYFIDEEALSECRLLFRYHAERDGLPGSMFTVLFAVARTVGWIAQWKEMMEDPSQKSAVYASSMLGRRGATTSRSASARN